MEGFKSECPKGRMGDKKVGCFEPDINDEAKISFTVLVALVADQYLHIYQTNIIVNKYFIYIMKCCE